MPFCSEEAGALPQAVKIQATLVSQDSSEVIEAYRSLAGLLVIDISLCTVCSLLTSLPPGNSHCILFRISV